MMPVWPGRTALAELERCPNGEQSHLGSSASLGPAVGSLRASCQTPLPARRPLRPPWDSERGALNRCNEKQQRANAKQHSEQRIWHPTVGWRKVACTRRCRPVQRGTLVSGALVGSTRASDTRGHANAAAGRLGDSNASSLRIRAACCRAHVDTVHDREWSTLAPCPRLARQRSFNSTPSLPKGILISFRSESLL